MVTLNPDDMTPVINRLRRAQGQIHDRGHAARLASDPRGTLPERDLKGQGSGFVDYFRWNPSA